MRTLVSRIVLAATFVLALTFTNCGQHSWEEDVADSSSSMEGNLSSSGDDPSSSSNNSPNSSGSKDYGSYTPGTYLLTTQWAQGVPYKNQMPFLENGELDRTYCGVIASAQIMKYHEWPKGKMTGIIPAYERDEIGEIPATDLSDIIFDWKNMKNIYKAGSYTDTEADAVATFVRVVRNATWSGASSYAQGTYFDYSFGQRLIRRNNIGDNWDSILREQIDASLPVYHWGKGTKDNGSDGQHVYILDGYNNLGEFHVNWGWGGKDDGWYKSTAFLIYNESQYARINMAPRNDLTDALSNALTIVENATYLTIKGTVTNAEQARQKAEKIISTLGLGTGITFKIHDVGISPFPLAETEIGSEYKFVVSVTKNSVTFSSNIQTLTLINFAGGEGTEQSPYQIADSTQLRVLADAVNNSKAAIRDAFSDKHYKLTANINLSGYSNWTPIGTTSSRPFKGVFDGNGKIISKLTINTTNNAQGLFGNVSGGTVKNLGVEDISITTTGYNVGGIAGVAVGTSTISNCYTTGKITTDRNTGGIVGDGGNAATISNCYSTATLNGNGVRLGGIAGAHNDGVKTENCVALNPKIATATTSSVGRVTGGTTGTRQNNVAFAGMLNNSGTTVWSNKTLAGNSGEDITAEQIAADGTLGGRFTAPVWTTENGKLPGFGKAIDMPEYLR